MSERTGDVHPDDPHYQPDPPKKPGPAVVVQTPVVMGDVGRFRPQSDEPPPPSRWSRAADSMPEPPAPATEDEMVYVVSPQGTLNHFERRTPWAKWARDGAKGWRLATPAEVERWNSGDRSIIGGARVLCCDGESRVYFLEVGSENHVKAAAGADGWQVLSAERLGIRR